MKRLFSGLVLGGFLAVAAPARAQDCNVPAPDVVTTISLPGVPHEAIPTQDGCTIFVSLSSGQSTQGHIGVFSSAGGRITLLRDVVVPTKFGPTGMTLSHDGKLLAAADYTGVLLLDVARLMAGDGKPIIEATDDPGKKAVASSNKVVISPDDKLVFVSDESSTTVTVYDLARLKGGDTKATGQITVGEYPIGLVFSPDGSKLYSISEEAQPGLTPVTCPQESGANGPATAQGLLTVVDVARAATDPAGSVLAKVAGGCDPVRLALSKDGGRIFVTDRSADSVSVFDAAKLVTDSGHAWIGAAKVGKAPVGVAVAGKYVVTSDSNRLVPSGRTHEWLSVIDPAALKVVGHVPAGQFPRDMEVTADGRTLLVINANSNSLELVDMARLTPAYFARVKPSKDADDAQQARTQAALEARIESRQAAPGAEAALRHIMESFVNGKPDYDAMGSDRANIMRVQGDRMAARFQKFGALQSIAFKYTGSNGVDEFDVIFEHARTAWGIELAPDGKAVILGLDDVKMAQAGVP